MEQIYTPKQNYKVLCYCVTYNQAKYIEDTLNGFAMQNTNFPFACLVVEDCSTDGEQDVIKAWLERECDMSRAEYIDIELANLILVPHMANQNCSFAIYLLKKNLWKEPELKNKLVIPWLEHCKYEALCEGDDYWICKDKIQSQYDILEYNQSYSAIASNSLLVNLDGANYGLFSKNKSQIYNSVSELVVSRKFHTASVMYRIKMYRDSPFYNKTQEWDTWLWCCLLTMGPIRYENRVTCAYRKGTGISTTTETLRWIKINKEWSDTIIKYFGQSYISKEAAYYSTLCDIVKCRLSGIRVCDEDKQELNAIFCEIYSIGNCLPLIRFAIRYLCFNFFSKTMKSLSAIIK